MASLLRPDPIELQREWQALVEAEYEQVERLREFRDDDHYASFAHHFADDPLRQDDLLLNELRAWSRPDAVWADIGAGGGRYALPLALANQRVIAVEPSAGMREVLLNSAKAHGISNLDVVPLSWPEGAEGVDADFILVAHVGYDVRPIGPFLDAIEAAGAQRCFWMLMDRAPSGGFGRLWEQVHGEPRQQLPGMREFLHLLLARGVTPDVRVVARNHSHDDPEGRLETARRRLWLRPGSPKDLVLQQILADGSGVSDGDWELPTSIGLIHWAPRNRA